MNEERILIFAPVGRDGMLARTALARAEIASETCASMEELCSKLAEGAGAAILTEESLAGARAAAQLAEALERQPPWSDLPVILFGSRELRPGRTHNFTQLDRPVPMRTLLTAASSALRARRRQYEVRALLGALEQSVRDRDQFLAMLGHELRNPLAAILTASELLERKVPDQAARERAVINRQTRHLSRMVDDLLDVARVTRGRVVLRLETVDLRQFVTRAIATCEKAAQAQGVTLSSKLPPEPLEVAADPMRLEQIVSNLVGNAIKYTNAGGRVELEVDARGAEARLRVRDTGVGIDPAMLPRIFDLFTQGPTSIDRAQGGMGIGLTLAQRLAALHRGAIEARSEGPGKGSEFELRLPLGHANRAGEAQQEPSSEARALRVLLVEDNPDTRDVLQTALEQMGHSVEPVGDGAMAIARALAERPDAMLIDLGLPGRDGYEVAREVRRALGDAVRLVALTGYGQPEDRARAVDAGYDAFLVKPAGLDAVDRALRAG